MRGGRIGSPRPACKLGQDYVGACATSAAVGQHRACAGNRCRLHTCLAGQRMLCRDVGRDARWAAPSASRLRRRAQARLGYEQHAHATHEIEDAARRLHALVQSLGAPAVSSLPPQLPTHTHTHATQPNRPFSSCAQRRGQGGRPQDCGNRGDARLHLVLVRVRLLGCLHVTLALKTPDRTAACVNAWRGGNGNMLRNCRAQASPADPTPPTRTHARCLAAGTRSTSASTCRTRFVQSRAFASARRIERMWQDAAHCCCLLIHPMLTDGPCNLSAESCLPIPSVMSCRISTQEPHHHHRHPTPRSTHCKQSSDASRWPLKPAPKTHPLPGHFQLLSVPLDGVDRACVGRAGLLLGHLPAGCAPGVV